MLPVNCGSHADYQNFVIENLRKYYPDLDALARSTWDIIERFWHLDLSDTDVLLADKYSRFGPAPRTPSCMQRSYLLSIDFKVFCHRNCSSLEIIFIRIQSGIFQYFSSFIRIHKLQLVRIQSR